MQIDTEIDVLKLVCQRLAEQNFSYMLTGSLATNLYVVPRMTRDIDLVIELKKPDVYPKKLKTWSFAKVSTLDLIPLKQLLFKWIGGLLRGD